MFKYAKIFFFLILTDIFCSLLKNLEKNSVFFYYQLFFTMCKSHNRIRREIPKSIKNIQDKLHEIKILIHEEKGIALTVFKVRERKTSLF